MGHGEGTSGGDVLDLDRTHTPLLRQRLPHYLHMRRCQGPPSNLLLPPRLTSASLTMNT